jgi:hypothetical protein
MEYKSKEGLDSTTVALAHKDLDQMIATLHANISPPPTLHLYCDRHGRLPFDNFYLSDINVGRQRCKKCAGDQYKLYRLSTYLEQYG